MEELIQEEIQDELDPSVSSVAETNLHGNRRLNARVVNYSSIYFIFCACSILFRAIPLRVVVKREVSVFSDA